MTTTAARYWLGIDIGGTFTDFALFDTRTGELIGLKVPSTPPVFAEAVETGLAELAREHGVDLTADRRRRARHHDRREHAHPARGRAPRPPRHRGLPRRAGAPAPAPDEPVRPGRWPSHAPDPARPRGRGARAAPRGRRRGHGARRGQRAGRRGPPDRPGRGGPRGLAASLVREPRARAPREGARREGLGPPGERVGRRVAAGARVRADGAGRARRVRPAAGAALPGGLRAGAGRPGRARGAVRDQVERRHHAGGGGARADGGHAPLRAGLGRDRRGVRREPRPASRT